MADVGRYASAGLFIIRLGLGASFIYHGLGKFMGGENVLTAVGSAVSNIGIHENFYAFGIAAATAEMLGGLLLILGLFFRLACLMLVSVMGMAMYMHIKSGDGFKGYSHAMEVGIVFLGLFVTGPGAYALGRKRKAAPSAAGGESKPKKPKD